MNCPVCNAVRLQKKGFRNTKSRGKVQRYQCMNCKYSFTSSYMHRMKNTRKVVEFALRLDNQGLSLRDIEKRLFEKFNVKVSHATVHNWLNNFSLVDEGMTDFAVTIKCEEFTTVLKVTTTKEKMMKTIGKLIDKPMIKKKDVKEQKKE